MDSERLYDQSTPQQTNRFNIKNKRRAAIIIAVAVVVIIIIAILLIVRPGQVTNPDYKLYRTGFNATQNFTYINGSDLYAYNGAGFYKVDLNDSDSGVSVLNNGIRLPAPSHVYWANDKGAMLTFKESFYRTKVEDVLRTKGQDINDTTKAFAWYLDFATGNLKLVAAQPIDAASVSYSEASDGFYYMPINSTEAVFYSIAKDTNSIAARNVLLTDISYATQCQTDSQRFCLIARDATNPQTQKLFGIDNSGKLNVILDSEGRLFPTNNPALYISSPQGNKTASDPRKDDGEQADFRNSPAYLEDISAKDKHSLSFDISGIGNLFTLFTPTNTFYAFDTSSDANATSEGGKLSYRFGSIDSSGNASSKQFPIQYADGSAYTGQVISIVPGTETMLLTDINGQQALFSQNANSSVTAVAQQDVQNIIQECTTRSIQSSQYFESSHMFRIYVIDDANFAPTIKAFSNCLAKSSKSAFVGYTYQFAGVSPENGRTTTD